MLIVDAGPLIAVADASDQYHPRCAQLLSQAAQPLPVPILAAAEAAYMIGRRAGPKGEQAFARAFVGGELCLEPVEPSDWDRIAELMEQYVDLPLGIADASVVALAERLGATEIATLDRRHFSAVRPRHVESFTLLPWPSSAVARYVHRVGETSWRWG
jgi:predicted nucleic acid-binding protein